MKNRLLILVCLFPFAVIGGLVTGTVIIALTSHGVPDTPVRYAPVTSSAAPRHETAATNTAKPSPTTTTTSSPSIAETAGLTHDPVTGMVIAPNWELVRTHCIACHSAQQFLRQKGTRQTWVDIIQWMQKYHGLWQFDPDTEKKILDYLAENYAPEGSWRRAPIPPLLMPENPYPSDIPPADSAQQGG